MTPLEVIAAIRATLAVAAVLGEALEQVQNGKELTPEQQDAVTQARKLATANLVACIDEKLKGQP